MTSRHCLSRAIKAFLRQMAADGRTPASAESYRRQLVLLTQALGDVPLSRLTPDRLNGYLSSPALQLKVDGMPKQTSTINGAKSVIRAFFRIPSQFEIVRCLPPSRIRESACRMSSACAKAMWICAVDNWSCGEPKEVGGSGDTCQYA